MIKAIIIDDEKDAVSFIKSLIEEYCEDVKVIGEANSAKEGYKTINELNPDLVFLDVEMPNGSGFDLLKKFEKIKFKIIFITAYNHYAIQAIKYSAMDYILKPIDIEEFTNAIEKVKQAINKEGDTFDYNILLENLKTTVPQKIAIPTGQGIEYINTREIIRIEADRSYSMIYLLNGNKILVSRGLREFQELLNGRNFFRAHNSHLINIEHVKLYAKQDGGFIRMIDDLMVAVSRSKKELFIERMKEYTINLKK